MSTGGRMLFILSFLVFLGAAIVGLLLAMDAGYARAHRAAGLRWAASDAGLIDDPGAGGAVLPAEIRLRLWALLAASCTVGCMLLIAAR